jgi:hypothetical protein
VGLVRIDLQRTAAAAASDQKKSGGKEAGSPRS